jgi:predicted dehydrogenase
MRPVSVAVVGCGYWGPKLIRNFAELPQAQLVAVADVREYRLMDMAVSYPKVRFFTDYREVLRTDVEAVVIATPVSTHFQIAWDCLTHGKHVLVEKPLVGTCAQGEALIEMAEMKGLVLMVGHTFEHNPAVEILRELVQSQELGEVYNVNATRVNLGIFRKDINVMWDLAAHDLSILHYVLGLRPDAVSARGSAFVQPGIQDVAYLTLRFPRGILAHVHVSWLDPCKARKLTIVGSKKMVVYDDVESLEKVRIYDKGVAVPSSSSSFGDFQLSYRYGNISIPYIPPTEPLRVQCSHFLECILEGRTPKSSGIVGLRVVRVLESAQKSLSNGGMEERIDWVEPKILVGT